MHYRLIALASCITLGSIALGGGSPQQVRMAEKSSQKRIYGSTL